MIKLRSMRFLGMIVVLVIVLSLDSCEKEEKPAPPIGEFQNAMFVVNEGNFTAGNASLTYYNYKTSAVSQQVFYRINGAPLGDVANSITFDENSIYIVVNNSHVVYKINAVTGKYQAKTTGLTSPRYILKIDNQRALVSDLYENNLTLINTENMEIISRIALGRTSENLLKYGNEIFITNWSAFQQDKPNNMIMIVDSENLQVTDSTEVGMEPNSMVLDKNNHLWVLCSGGYLNEEVPTLWKIDPENKDVLMRLEFPDLNSSPDNLHINKTGDTLYYLNKNVYRMAISTTQLPDNYFVRAGENDNFYALGVSPGSDVYVTDANDYTRNGTVYRYTPGGVLVQKFEAGIAPGDIGFID